MPRSKCLRIKINSWHAFSIIQPNCQLGAERFIRTLKENLLWIRTFGTVEELRRALLDFREAYNRSWLIERHGCRSPNAAGQDQLPTAALAS